MFFFKNKDDDVAENVVTIFKLGFLSFLLIPFDLKNTSG